MELAGAAPAASESQTRHSSVELQPRGSVFQAGVHPLVKILMDSAGVDPAAFPLRTEISNR